MSLTSALRLSLSGLDATQRQVELAGANILGANTPGYTRKGMEQIAVVGDGQLIGVRNTRIQRELDTAMQQQMWSQGANLHYDASIAHYQSRLDELFATPGGGSGLDTSFNQFVQAAEALATTPESAVTRFEVVNAAETLADNLRNLSGHVQSMRLENEQDLRTAAHDINDALNNIATLNDQIVSQYHSAQGAANLDDQLDIHLGRLNDLLGELHVRRDRSGRIDISTASGVSLISGAGPAQAHFDQRGTINPQTFYDIDPNNRGVGTLTLINNGSNIDLLQPGILNGGRIAAARDLRDGILPGVQDGLDELARQMALTLSNNTIDGTVVTVGAQQGFELNVSALRNGNVATLTARNNSTGSTQVFSFVRVDYSATLPLSNDVTARSDDTVIGIDFSGGQASIVAQIQAALGSSFTVSDQGSGVVRVLDDGAAGQVDVTGFSASVTPTGLVDEGVGLPLFIDGNIPFTNSLDSTPQKLGFAGRIQVNGTILDDPSHLVVYQTTPETFAGDATRPTHIYEALTQRVLDFSPSGGVNSTQTTVFSFAGDIVSTRGTEAEAATRKADSQRSTFEVIEARFLESSEVSIDAEMAKLIELENAYAANAKVLEAVKTMFDELMASV